MSLSDLLNSPYQASFSRSIFSQLIPPGMEGQFFSLFAVTDRGSSWLGPVLVGVLADRFGSIRHGFFVIVFLLSVSIPMIAMVDLTKGKRQARKFRQS